jgi:hypothetical protein
MARNSEPGMFTTYEGLIWLVGLILGTWGVCWALVWGLISVWP